MTIKELQEKLKEFDENSKVRVRVKSPYYDDSYISGSLDDVYFSDIFDEIVLTEE